MIEILDIVTLIFFLILLIIIKIDLNDCKSLLSEIRKNLMK
jgi:hypothetical protein